MAEQQSVRAPAHASGVSSIGRILHLQVNWRGLLILGLIVLGPWVVVLGIGGARLFSRPDGAGDGRGPARGVPGTATSGPIMTRPTHSTGAWGELETVRITTEPPAEFAARFMEYDSGTWQLADFTTAKLADLLKGAGVTDAQAQAILAAATPDTATNGLTVKPPPAVLIDLAPEAREKVYRVVGADPRNFFHNDPFRYRADVADEWLGNTGFPAPVIELARRVTYRRGPLVLISDVAPLLAALPSDPERIRLLKTLSRKSTLMVTLNVSPRSDVDALVEYWGRGSGRAKDVRPLLESLTKIHGGAKLDMAHLLTRFARKRLYSYPSSAADAAAKFDCHWTSLNFWNEPADDRLTDSARVAQVLATDYHPEYGERRYGDVIFFMRSASEAIHSVVYIADDIVFTKNGTSITAPWILMKLSDVVAYYETQGEVQLRTYRRNE